MFCLSGKNGQILPPSRMDTLRQKCLDPGMRQFNHKINVRVGSNCINVTLSKCEADDFCEKLLEKVSTNSTAADYANLAVTGETPIARHAMSQ